MPNSKFTESGIKFFKVCLLLCSASCYLQWAKDLRVASMWHHVISTTLYLPLPRGKLQRSCQCLKEQDFFIKAKSVQHHHQVLPTAWYLAFHCQAEILLHTFGYSSGNCVMPIIIIYKQPKNKSYCFHSNVCIVKSSFSAWLNTSTFMETVHIHTLTLASLKKKTYLKGCV